IRPDPIDIALRAALARRDERALLLAVAHMLELRIRHREALHRVDARNADAAELAEGLDRIALRIEPAREHVGILKRHARALPRIRQHRMRRIADELDAATAPIIGERPGKE